MKILGSILAALIATALLFGFGYVILWVTESFGLIAGLAALVFSGLLVLFVCSGEVD